MKKGSIHTPEARAKMSTARKVQVISPETCAKMSATHRGSKFNPEHCANIAAAKIGEKNPRWKGGRFINSGGYFLVLRPDHPFADCRGYVMEHRLINEAHIGRFLLPTEVVHHINGNIKDNCIENLMLFSSMGKHLKHHWIERKKQ